MEYLGQPVLTIAPDFTQMRSGQLDDFTFESVGQGGATPWKPTEGPRRMIAYPFSLAGRSQIDEFRRFFIGRGGKLLGFWLPVYLLDYKLTGDVAAAATEIEIEHVGLAEAAALEQFQHLILLDAAGGLVAAEIAGVSADGDVETITLAAPLAAGVAARETLCGGLMFARFQEDELAYHFEGLDFCRALPRFVELPAEYAEPEAGSAPVYLYEVTKGGTVYRFAGWALDLVAGGETWEAADITHGEMTAGIEAIGEAVQLRLATDDPEHPFRAFLEPYVLDVSEVKIWEVDAADLPESLAAEHLTYRGQIGEVSFGERGGITLQLSSILRIGEEQGPRFQITRTANQSVYELVDPAAFTTEGTITGLNARPPWVEAAEFGAKATAESDPDWFALGRVTCGAEVRFCVGQDGDRLYLNAPFAAAAVDDPISARAGDDGRIETWAAKFDAVAEFPGFPYVPNVNPQFEALKAPEPKGGKK